MYVSPVHERRFCSPSLSFSLSLPFCLSEREGERQAKGKAKAKAGAKAAGAKASGAAKAAPAAPAAAKPAARPAASEDVAKASFALRRCRSLSVSLCLTLVFERSCAEGGAECWWWWLPRPEDCDDGD